MIAMIDHRPDDCSCYSRERMINSSGLFGVPGGDQSTRISSSTRESQPVPILEAASSQLSERPL